MIDCPYCLEKIKKNALKCKHCGENLVEKNFIVVLSDFFNGVINTVWKTSLVLLFLFFLIYSCIQSVLNS